MGRMENDGCRWSARNQWGRWGSLQQPVGWMLICWPQVPSRLTTHYVKVQFLLHIWKFPSQASSTIARDSKSGVWSGHTSLTLWFVRKAKSWLNPGPTGSESALQQVPQVICRAHARCWGPWPVLKSLPLTKPGVPGSAPESLIS